MLTSLYRFFSSLKLTVACLVLGCVIVFWGTIAQVHLGLYKAQNEFFRSFFVYWTAGRFRLAHPHFPRRLSHRHRPAHQPVRARTSAIISPAKEKSASC